MIAQIIRIGFHSRP